MNKGLLVSIIAASSAGLSGCAPLQQAPLVYSSKVIVGVDVSMTVAENQGGSVNLGVKTIDSAYVPVAVSKEIDNKSINGEGTLDVKLIEARYGEGSSSGQPDDANVAERNRKIDTYFSARRIAEAAAEAQATAENNLSAINTLISRVEALKSGLITAQSLTDTPPDNQRADAFKKRADELTKLNAEASTQFTALNFAADGSNNSDKVIKDIDSWLAENRKSKAVAEDRLPALKLQRQTSADHAAQAKSEAIRVVGLSQTNKTDAMSVYGRFDSAGSGKAKEGSGSLLVGKVFSTGLASQNLTEAVKIEARSHCISNGFELAKTITVDESRKTFLAALEKICSQQNGSGS